nr:sigma-70 family RNA polymerase sigma factor [Novosphingobium sp. Fuku2-ISO-50]
MLRYLGRRAGYDAAPDMLQEVFVRAAGSAQVGRLNNPAAFLRRVARNLLIDRSRRRGADDVIVFPLDEEQHAASLPEQEHHLEARDLMRLYEGAVDALPEKTRRVFLMHRVDELSYREIHERLGISIATVEYHMMKALAQIARAVDAGR